VHGNENAQEYRSENIGVEIQFENVRNEIIEEGDEISVCTKEWRDWSLELTEKDGLVITGKVDKWVFDMFLFYFYSPCLPVLVIIMNVLNIYLIFLLSSTLLIYISNLTLATYLYPV
jgi:hypothetical protein